MSFWRFGVLVGATLLAQPLGLGVGPAGAAPAVVGGGGVLAWGMDATGQLGDGPPSFNQSTPVAVSGLGVGSGVVKVAGGFGHSLALRSDGSVLAWGADSAGQLGDGGLPADQAAPVPVSGLGAGSGVVAIAAGENHSLALRGDGSVLAWGSDSNGQLGTAAPVSASVPAPVSGLGAGSGVVAIAAGSRHSLALRGDGSVVAWGADFSGQLGDGGPNTDRFTPVAVSGLGVGSGAVSISAGTIHSLALRSDGSVLAWGDDQSGQLGDGGPATLQTTPVAVTGLGSGSGIVAISAGGVHSLALRANGSVVGWGDDYFGQVGDGSIFVKRLTPVAVAGLGAGSGVTAIVGGGEHSLALRSDGIVLSWGRGQFGELGNGGGNTDQPTPVPVSGIGPGSGISLAAGSDHSLAVATGPLVGQTFAPLTPARVWDTRFGPGPLGRVGPAGTREVTVTGIGGVPEVGVTAVVLNLTAVGPSNGTFVTAWPTGELRPGASNLNVPPGDTRANAVVVKVGSRGRISVFNDAGTVDLVADIAGWYGPAGGQRYTPVTPARVADSRFGPGIVGRIDPAGTRDITVTGVGGVPENGVTAVVLNLTAVAPSAGTFLTAWPAGAARPLASNLNVPNGDTRPNLVVVKVGAGGKVSVFNAAGTVDLVADVAGWFGSTGASLTSVSPARVWDSRTGPGPVGAIGPGGTRDVAVTGTGGVPTAGVTAVVLNVTAVNPSAGTFVTVWPTGEPRPLASNLNIPAGDTRPNLVIVKVGAGGQVSVANDAGSVHVLADVSGWYGLPGG